VEVKPIADNEVDMLKLVEGETVMVRDVVTSREYEIEAVPADGVTE
jgi:hypothetical protein